MKKRQLQWIVLVLSVLLVFGMALAALIVGPIALEKADDAYDDVNGDSVTLTSGLYQATQLKNNSIVLRLKTIGDMNYVTLSQYTTDNVNSSLGNYFTSASSIPSQFIPKSPSGEYIDGPFQSIYYRIDSTPPTEVTYAGMWGVLSNGTIYFSLIASEQYLRIASATLVYPKVI